MNGNKFATSQILESPGRSREGADFSWLSSKVSWTLVSVLLIRVDFQETHAAFGPRSDLLRLHIWEPWEGMLGLIRGVIDVGPDRLSPRITSHTRDPGF